MTEDQIYNMSDEELERAFLDAKANEGYDKPAEESYNDEIEIMEQPDNVEDSIENDGATYDDDVNDLESESTEVVAQPDEEVTTKDDQLEEDEDSKDKIDEIAQQEHQELAFKANGREYKFTPEEIMAQFPKVFGQAMDYTRKTQAMKPWRKTIDAIEQAKLGHDDINLMIDVMKGNK